MVRLSSSTLVLVAYTRSPQALPQYSQLGAFHGQTTMNARFVDIVRAGNAEILSLLTIMHSARPRRSSGGRWDGLHLNLNLDPLPHVDGQLLPPTVRVQGMPAWIAP